MVGFAMSTNVHLTPELERFARECVAEGRYNNVSEVVRSALRLLQEIEEQRRQFTASLLEAEEEADREGTFTVEEVRAGAQAIIDAHKR
jgi:antitoxin ParD1/3/4